MLLSLLFFFSSSSFSPLLTKPLTSEFTLLHDSVSGVGLEPHGVFDPVDVDGGVSTGLALEQCVPSRFDDFHRRILSDPGEARG